MAALTKLEVAATHILKQIPTSKKPLFVAVQGPQGSGKTYLSGQLRNYLTSDPHNLRTAVLSIDDLYLPHAGLTALANSQPLNPLWRGRGQPGTHDIDLGVKILSALKEGTSNVELPRFDKSLHDGKGDRLPMDGSGIVVQQPPVVDVVILEGWCVGFYPIPQRELDSRWDGVWKEERDLLGMPGDTLCDKVDIERINEALDKYVQFWNLFDTFIQIKPASFDYKDPSSSQFQIVYQWRLEQEHYMKANNGGRGMTDDAVKGFVDRYIPGYVFFGDIPPPFRLADQPRWIGKSLAMIIDDHMTLVKAVEF